MDERLLTVLKDFLEATLNGRRMCPRCAGFLPRHEPDCHLGRLAEAYVDTELPALQLAPIPSLTKTGRTRKARKTIGQTTMFGDNP